MGVLDLPGVALSWLDGGLDDVLPDTMRIVFWSALAGVACMAMYALISRQDRLAVLKREAREARAALAAYDGEFDGVLRIARDNLRISLKRLQLSLFPAMAASLPLLLVAVWMSNSFAYEKPEPGQAVEVLAVWTSDRAVSADADARRRWNLTWPENGTELTITAPGGEPLAEISAAPTASIIHPRRWWNVLIGNPAGYLPAASPVEELRLSLERARYVSGVPRWMAGWEFLFIMVATLASLSAKTLLRLN